VKIEMLGSEQGGSEGWWQALTEGLSDQVLVIDADDRLLFLNRPFDDQPAPALGEPALACFPEEQVETHRRALAEARRTGQRVHYEAQGRQERWHSHRLLPVPATSSSRGEVMMIVASIDERRQLEQQLHPAQKMEAVGRLAGGVAHDFNNLLAVILSCTEFLLADLGDNEQAKADVLDIRQAGQRAASLTRQLLAFSRKQVLRPELLSLNELVTDTGKLLRRIIGEDVRFVTELEPSLAEVMADRGQMEQVFLNLAVNARDAMPSGGSLIVETANVEVDAALAARIGVLEPGRHVRLTVRDTGIGMSEATLTRIFEPFFTTKESGKGTGLGLATVFGIVKQSHGGIAVESSPGHGAVFRIYLPQREGDPKPLSLRKAPVRSKTGSETILLVEDDEQLRAVVRRMLVKSGYRVIEARDGGAALATYEANADRIDLIITDLVIPSFDGITVASELQSRAPSVRVIYMSGYTEHLVLRRASLTPGVNFLQKPFTGDDLVSIVRKVLDR
jgi:signal transduction histidine kinase